MHYILGRGGCLENCFSNWELELELVIPGRLDFKKEILDRKPKSINLTTSMKTVEICGRLNFVELKCSQVGFIILGKL